MEEYKNKHVPGGAGGDEGGREAKDTLRSAATLEVLEAICEGEIEGFAGATPLESVYIDGVPAEYNGVPNFKGVSVDYRFGTQNQTYIPGIIDGGAASSEVNIAQEVTAQSSVTKLVTAGKADYIRVTLSVPRLHSTTKSGNTYGTHVTMEIAVRPSGQANYTVVGFGGRETIEGKASGKYQRSYMIDLGQLPAPTGGTYEVRVTRVTADSTTLKRANKTYWDSYTVVTKARLRYPNTALVRTAIDSTQFSKIPVRGYLIKGLKVRIPDNYDPVTRVYSGSWGGTFKTEWTNNPAWILYDLLTEERYGLGETIDDDLQDKWLLYTIGQYCDELVDDGQGGTEPRFTCNLYLQTLADAARVVKDLASVFRAMAFWNGLEVFLSQDKPKQVSNQFTPANVIDGVFNYSGTPKSSRFTVAKIRWSNPDNSYKSEIEYVEDPSGVARYGIVETSSVAFGCTSRGQAHRLGKYILLTSRLESGSVQFKVGLDAMYLAPGNIIKVLDPAKAGVRFGGRTVSATTTEVVIDSGILLETGKTYMLTCMLSDGTLEEKTITNAADDVNTQDTFGVDTAFTTAPGAFSVWTVTSYTGADPVVEPRLYRVMKVVEEENDDRLEYTVSAMEYSDDKFSEIDNLGVLPALPDRNVLFNEIIEPPAAGPLVEEGFYISATASRRFLDISWEQSPSTHLKGYVVELRVNNGPVELYRVPSESYRLDNPMDGDYEISVRAINLAGHESASVSTTYEVTSVAPVDELSITGLELIGKGNITDFEGKDANFVWRVTSTSRRYELGQEPFGGDSGGTDPWFKDYEITVLDDAGATLRIDYTTSPEYVYTLEKNTEDGGPRRSFAVQVRARDYYNRFSSARTLAVANPAPLGLTNVSASAGFKRIHLSYDAPTDPDFAGVAVWLDTSTGFTPSDDNLVYESLDYPITIEGLETGTNYYLRFAAFDEFGKAGITYSSEFAVTTQSIVDVDIASVGADKITTDILYATITVQTAGLVSAVSGSWSVDLGPVAVGSNVALLSFTNGVDTPFAIYEDGSMDIVMISTDEGIYSGKTGYADDVNAGFFLGNEGGTPKFKVGSSEHKYLGYDGDNVVLGRETQILGADTYNGDSFYVRSLWEEKESVYYTEVVGSVPAAIQDDYVFMPISEALSVDVGDSTLIWRKMQTAPGVSLATDILEWGKDRSFKAMFVIGPLSKAFFSAYVGTGNPDIEFCGMKYVEGTVYGCVVRGGVEYLSTLGQAISDTRGYLLEVRTDVSGGVSSFYIDGTFLDSVGYVPQAVGVDANIVMYAEGVITKSGASIPAVMYVGEYSMMQYP